MSLRKRFDPVLAGIALLAAFLNIWGIWKDEYANAYYTAAVTSMLQNFHNFFYASFDPAGYVSVDKPPVAFWLQTLSASLFGVHGWSVILPQALAGVGSVLFIYVLVKPSFGRAAARLAALVAAVTPIAVAVSRTNNVDSLLVFTLLAGTWLLFKGVRTKKGIWVAASFAVVGLAFNIKMLQAYMILPAFYLFYLLAFEDTWKRRLRILAGATAVLLVVSFSWALIVDSIPAQARPYVGSSQTNSVTELAFGYNGMSRLTGMGGPGGSQPPNSGQISGQSQDSGQLPNGGQMPESGQDGSRDRMPEGYGPVNTGQAGPLRLFQSELSGQISWLLPFALVAAVGLLTGVRKDKAGQKETIFWLAWLLPAMAFFSAAGFFHSYYLIMLAPAIAALTGAGWVELVDVYRNRTGWRAWLLPSGIVLTALFEVYILWPFKGQIGMVWPAAVGIAGVGISLVLFFRLATEKFIYPIAIGSILVLLAAPFYWSATPLLYGGNSMLPEAGPQLAATGNITGMAGTGRQRVDAQLLSYLTANNTGEKYLFATMDSQTAAPYIIETGKAVMAMGGFSGSDPIMTADRLEQMVADNEVKYFLISSGGMGRGNSEVQQWIIRHGKEIPQEEWQGNSGGTNAASLSAGETSMNDLSMGQRPDGNVPGGMGREGSLTLYVVNP